MYNLDSGRSTQITSVLACCRFHSSNCNRPQSGVAFGTGASSRPRAAHVPVASPIRRRRRSRGAWDSGPPALRSRSREGQSQGRMVSPRRMLRMQPGWYIHRSCCGPCKHRLVPCNLSTATGYLCMTRVANGNKGLPLIGGARMPIGAGRNRTQQTAHTGFATGSASGNAAAERRQHAELEQ